MNDVPFDDLAPVRQGEPDPATSRPHYRPPVGIPMEEARTTRAAVLSLLLHIAIIALLLAPPIFVTAARFDVDNREAGGPGAVGGGGGGSRGTGGSIFERINPERLRYVQVAPTPTPPAAVVKPRPKPVVPPARVAPPKPRPDPVPPPLEPQPQPQTPAPPTVKTELPPATPVRSNTAGTGGGSGSDGTAGNGSGSGGGTGSGVGTGRGSGNGAGTGGGDARQYPPTPIAIPVLPLPVPSKVRPYTMLAYFDVDTNGVAKLLGFNPSKDDGYNRRIREMLLEIRFRPAVRFDGRPVRDTAKITYTAP